MSEEVDPLVAEFLASPESKSKYSPLAFSSPIDVLEFFDDNIHNDIVTPHRWQREMLDFVAQPFTFKDRLELGLCAANGSGKDSYFITPLVVWLLLTQVRHKVIITSASYTQLSTQTEAYIKSLCNRINVKLAEQGIHQKAFLIKKEYIFCFLTGAECILFSTNEPGRAEGHHPPQDCPTAEETIIINEAKTVPDEIFEALSRCTYNRWIEVSSPGHTGGKFYFHFRDAIEWPETYQSGRRYVRKITSFDCPHKSIKSIMLDKIEMGENSPLYRSKHLAEFTSLDEQVVITLEQLRGCLSYSKEYRPIELGRRAGLDLAAGGDENALYVFDDNKFVGRETFRATDTAEVTVPTLISFFQKWNLKPENIYGDDGGVGKSIIDNLKKNGWAINRVLNQSAAITGQNFGNRGAELWFSLARLIQEKVLILPPDDIKLHAQLTSRYYTQHKSNGRIILESKRDARAKGHGSPDRADAIALCFSGVSITRFIDFSAPEVKDKRLNRFSDMAALEEWYENNHTYGTEQRVNKEQFVRGSLNVLIENRKANDDDTYIGEYFQE